MISPSKTQRFCIALLPAICANSILKNCVGKTKVYATLLKGWSVLQASTSTLCW
ncbi:Uncharacterised protein [Vibrio cholerae]|uniref:Uncharacterized protein n=1 Tax=Vibrio cholerae TaxID=666 RepID=A0A656AC20_VIBCL|nr:Uncharacterised protein [Vibrio cholerae]